LLLIFLFINALFSQNACRMNKIAYAGCLGVMGIISTEFGIIGILPAVAASYHIPIARAGYLLSAFAFTIFLTGPFTVLATSGINRKKMMLAALAVFVASNVVSAFAPPFWLLLGLRIVPAFLHPVFFSAVIGAVLKAAKPAEQHRLLGIVIGGVAITQVSILPLSAYLASAYGWQSSFVLQGGISLLALGGIGYFIPDLPVTAKKSYGSQLAILRQPAFLLSLAFTVLLVAAWFSTYSYFADYLGKAKRLTPAQISAMLLLFGVAGVGANWLAGRFLARSVPLTTAFFLLGTILLPLVLAYSGHQFPVQLAVVAFWGLMYGPCFLTALAYVLQAAPEAPEFANSLQASFGNLGVSLGTVLGGWFVATHSLANLPWVGAAFGALALLVMGWRGMLASEQPRASHSHLPAGSAQLPVVLH
jgi:predicted MFS family arabinose efflux permease